MEEKDAREARELREKEEKRQAMLQSIAAHREATVRPASNDIKMQPFNVPSGVDLILSKS